MSCETSCTYGFCSLYQTAIDWNYLQYGDLPCNSFAERLKKAKLITGFTQKTLSEATGLSISTICELEAGYRENISLDTLNKLLKVLDTNILCDDYYKFVLDQEKNITLLINTYGITKLCNLINTHHSTIYNWLHNKYIITRKKYNLIKNLDQNT